MTPDGTSACSSDQAIRRHLGDRPVTLADLGTAQRSVGPVALRRYPFPFRCALAVSNDPRGCSAEAFADIYRSFEQRGLELGAGASFDAADFCNISAPIALELGSAGLLDTIFGLPFEGADAASDKLACAGIAPSCHVADSTIQDAAPLAAAGVRFFSDDGFSTSEKFGDAYTFRVTPLLREAFDRMDFGQIGAGRGSSGTDVVDVLESLDEADRRRFVMALFNDPIISVTLDDGTALEAFKRYRGPQRPAAPLLPLQLRSQFLHALEGSGGAVIVAQRLGDFARIGMAEADEGRRPVEVPVFGQHELIALDDLAERATDRVLVAATGRLLSWLALQRDLPFDVEQGESWQILVSGEFSEESLEGLAFQLPAEAPETHVIFKGSRLDTRRAPDPSLPGHDCIYLPWTRRSWPI